MTNCHSCFRLPSISGPPPCRPQRGTSTHSTSRLRHTPRGCSPGTSHALGCRPAAACRARSLTPHPSYALTGVERLSRPPQTRTRAHRWAARTPGARPMHPLRSPHARATTLLRRRRGERLECTDAVAGSAAGCHAVWRRDASFLSPRARAVPVSPKRGGGLPSSPTLTRLGDPV